MTVQLENVEPDLQASNSSLTNSILTGRNLKKGQTRRGGALPRMAGWVMEAKGEKENSHSTHAKMLVILNMQNKN